MFIHFFFLSFLLFIQKASSDLTKSKFNHELSSNEEFFKEKLAILENEIVVLRKQVTKIKQNDLESNITEIMRILEVHGLVSISQIRIMMNETSKLYFLSIKTLFKLDS